ncbi:DegV family protein [Mycoplasma sp. P36-A1]|uniref:DegV family protein n=1 Tax=Mycoplasma sp. P36-A1 TaxID=3252900 RepID=UPI003C2C25F3
MRKTAFIIDSASFLSEKEAKELGLYFLPLNIIIDNKDYQEGVNLDIDNLYNALELNKQTSTSQPSPGLMEDLIKKLKNDGYERAIFSGIASGLSKTQENFKAQAELLNFELHVIDSKSVGYSQLNSLLKVRDLIENHDMQPIVAINHVQEDLALSKTMLIVDDLNHLSKSGRMSATAAKIGGMLQIKPILQLNNDDGGKMMIADKVRTSKKAYKKMVDLMLAEVKDLKDYIILLAQFDAQEASEMILKDINTRYPNNTVVQKTLVPTVGVHTGLNTVGMQIAKK